MTEVSLPLPKVRRSVSHSEVEAHLRCERNHFYSYGMEIERISRSAALSRGTLGHIAFDAYFSCQKKAQENGTWMVEGGVFPLDCLAEAMAVIMASTNDEVKYEVLGYFQWFVQNQKFSTWKILEVEREYVLDINEDLSYPFVVDLVAEDPWGNIHLIDHKFVYDFITDLDVELLGQLPKYAGALRAMGQRVDKVGYNQLRTRVVKNQTDESQYQFRSMSVTDERVQRTFLEQMLLATRIQAKKQHVLDNPETGLADWSRDSVRVANSMICRGCSFRSLCAAELNGQGAQMILDSQYRKKTRREISNKELED